MPAGRLRRDGDPRPGGHRRLVRLGFDAVRAVGLPVQEQGALREPLPGAVHLGGHRPDPRLVLHADGRRHAGLRQVLVRERRLPRAHPRRGRPQDVQAPGQHPAADPADGPARRGRGALVHGGRMAPPGRPVASGTAPSRRSSARRSSRTGTRSPSRPCTPAPPTGRPARPIRPRRTARSSTAGCSPSSTRSPTR